LAVGRIFIVALSPNILSTRLHRVQATLPFKYKWIWHASGTYSHAA